MGTIGHDLIPDDLAAAGGRPLQRGDPGWDDAVRLWNGMATPAPALVVQPRSAAGVAAAVGWARDRGLALGVKGGGHHIAGMAVPEGGLLLDLSGMREVTVDPEAGLAHVGPGCRLADVDGPLRPTGWPPRSASSPRSAWPA
jgi:FAD/FMN-containing dehydrogenase